jgi:hypothetical protein
MHTLSKQQVSNWVLLDYSAQKQVYQEKIKHYEQKYATDYFTFKQHLEQAQTENFEAWDDYIEWQAYHQFLNELLSKIEDIRHGHFQMA